MRADFAAATAPLAAAPVTAGALEYIAENEAFHRAVMVASGNGTAVELARKMRLPLIMSQLREALCREVLATSLAEHRAITEAILQGDAGRAEAAMRAHLERATVFVARVPERLFRA